jgi:regulator of protease activity HflC (stomatin/prohibitin superfamily)
MKTSDIVKIVCGVVVFIVLIALWPFRVVGAGERGVVLNWGAFNGQIMEPGIHIIDPIGTEVIKMNVQTQKLEVAKSEAYTHDLQVVDIQSALNYNIDPASSGALYKTIGVNYENKVISPNLEAAVKQTIAQYTAEEMLVKRGEVQSAIENNIKTVLAPLNITVTKYALENESFSTAFEQSIEQKQIAEQDALKAKNKLQQVQFEADQTVASAKAQAEAIKISSEAIQSAGGADYVKLQWVEAWKSGGAKVPEYITSDNGGSFLFNLK